MFFAIICRRCAAPSGNAPALNACPSAERGGSLIHTDPMHELCHEAACMPEATRPWRTGIGRHVFVEMCKGREGPGSRSACLSVVSIEIFFYPLGDKSEPSSPRRVHAVRWARRGRQRNPVGRRVAWLGLSVWRYAVFGLPFRAHGREGLAMIPSPGSSGPPGTPPPHSPLLSCSDLCCSCRVP